MRAAGARMNKAVTVLFFFSVIVIQFCWSRFCAVYGVAPDLVLVALLYVSMTRGAMQGQLFGFAWGIAWDILSGDLFGSHAFLYTMFGFMVGKLSHKMDESKVFTQVALTAAASLAAVGGMYVLYFIFGPQEYTVSGNYIVWARIVLNAAVAPLFFFVTSLFSRRSAGR